MLEVHRDRDGVEKPIAMMEDDHLVNYVNLMLSRAMAIKDAGGMQFSRTEQALYGLPQIDDEEIGHKIRSIIQKLYPYLSECYLRGIEDPILLLSEVLGRRGQIGHALMLED